MTKKKENPELLIDQNKSTYSKNSSEAESSCNDDKKSRRKKKLSTSESDEDKNPHKSKYQRKEESVIHMTAEEIRQIAYSNLHKFNNSSTVEKPKSLQDWVDHCKDVMQNPKPFEVTKLPPKPTTSHDKSNLDFFQYTPSLSKSFISSSSAVNNVKLDELYPISKGEIHKISEEPSESEMKSSTELPNNSTHLATIINCPLDNTYGARLLAKMGWRFGEGLGKDRDGIVKAVKFETKIDRRGLATAVEKHQSKKPQIKKPELDKNPVSILMEFCQKRKISPPIYEDVEEIGPSNMRQFRISYSILLIPPANLS